MDMIYNKCRKPLILLEDMAFTQEEVRVIEKYENPQAKKFNEAVWKVETADISYLEMLISDLSLSPLNHLRIYRLCKLRCGPLCDSI